VLGCADICCATLASCASLHFSGTEQQYSLLSNTLNSMDSAVAGEAAGMSIGLLLLGRLGEPLADAAVSSGAGLCCEPSVHFMLLLRFIDH
jgi:hypothetical protein